MHWLVSICWCSNTDTSNYQLIANKSWKLLVITILNMSFWWYQMCDCSIFSSDSLILLTLFLFLCIECLELETLNNHISILNTKVLSFDWELISWFIGFKWWSNCHIYVWPDSKPLCCAMACEVWLNYNMVKSSASRVTWSGMNG